MITAPAIFSRSGSFANRNFPTALADAPSATNTSEKPSTNASDVRRTCFRVALVAPPPPRISSSDAPETNET